MILLRLFPKLNKIRSLSKRSKKVTMSETTSLQVMKKTLDPVTGKYGWVVQDETYDFHQEIARSAFADMLHDSERNEKYYEGIKAAIDQKHREGKKAHVLDIGTGTGLLAMMAARSGADTIHACEAFLPISKCAEKVISENGLAERIKVIHKRSTDMTEDDLPRRCNILVTEVFDTELIGEGAIATFYHALTHLLEPDALVVPTSATVFAQVVESDWMQRWNRLAPWGDIAPSQAMQKCPGAAAVHDVQLSQLPLQDFTAITEPEPVFRFDWTCNTLIPVDDCSTVLTKALTSGTAQMVFMWWSLNMDPEGKIVLSCAPWWAHPSNPRGPDDIPWRDHWMQAVYYLPTPVPVTEGQTLKLLSSHDEFSMWFNVTTGDDVNAKLTKRPVCSCMMHASCSRTRIGMLNDPVRREKYFKVLQQLVTPESEVVCIGHSPLIAMLTATLGAKLVMPVDINLYSREVMETLVKDNNLESKIFLRPPKEGIRTTNLIVGEPYFEEGIYPWQNINQWFMFKRHLPEKLPGYSSDITKMPISASLYIMPMQFDHLHKIRAPLGSVCGFKMTAFDKLIQRSSSFSDFDVEVHPLWEYPGICLGKPKEVHSFRRQENFWSLGNMPFNVSGVWHGVVMWVDIHLDTDTTVHTGPVEPPTPGERVRWDPYTRQAVFFMMPEHPVTPENWMQYSVLFKITDEGDSICSFPDMKISFKLQT